MAIRVKYSIMSIMNAPLLGAIFGGYPEMVFGHVKMLLA